MKKTIALLLALIMVLPMAACAAKDTQTETPASNAAEAAPEQSAGNNAGGEREIVNYWHIHTGDEALVEDELVAAYNASQDKYEVVALSMNDQQKLIVAMSGDEGPDVVFTSNSNLTTYYFNGLLQNLQEYVDAENYDLTPFTEKSLESCTFDGNLYALPNGGCNQIQLFYNKDLLAAAGYNEPPATMEEMFEMGEKITTLDEDGNIDVLGYPLFPFASARQELIYAWGGRWWDDDGNLTPEAEGNLVSLHKNLEFREKYGIEKVQAFMGTANTNRYTEQDMFFIGKQAFRLDGTWLTTMIENNNPDLNYGITLVPATEDHPELRGVSRYETSTLMMPINAKNKEGAWDFIKYVSSYEGAKIMDIGRGSVPCRYDLLEDPDILAIPGFDAFIEANNAGNGINYPKMKDYAKYVSMIDNALDLIYNGYMTPEDALADLAVQAKDLQ